MFKLQYGVADPIPILAISVVHRHGGIVTTITQRPRHGNLSLVVNAGLLDGLLGVAGACWDDC